MEKGKRFASDFQRIDAVKPSDKLLIQDSEDGIVKFAFPNQITAVNGWKAVESIDDLPLNPARKDIGYIVGDNIYFWVGTGGDTLNGVYQKANIFKGEQGESGVMKKVTHNATAEETKITVSQNNTMHVIEGYVGGVLTIKEEANAIPKDEARILGFEFTTHPFEEVQVQFYDGESFNGTGSSRQTFPAGTVVSIMVYGNMVVAMQYDAPKYYKKLSLTYTNTNTNYRTRLVDFNYEEREKILAMFVDGQKMDINTVYDFTPYESIDVDIYIEKPTTITNLLDGKGIIRSMDVSDLVDRRVTNVSRFFKSCGRLGTLIGLNTWDTGSVVDMSYLFSDCGFPLDAMEIRGWDTSSVTNMKEMFRGSNLHDADLTDWDVSKVENMNSMFSGNDNLTSLDISGWDTSSVTEMYSVFRNCPYLTSIIGIEGLDISHVKATNNMFSECSKLTTLDLSAWDFRAVEDMGMMFYKCTGLTSVSMVVKSEALKTMAHMFYLCPNIENMDVTEWHIPNIENMNSTFSGTFRYIAFTTPFRALKKFDNAFTACPNLRSISFEGGCKQEPTSYISPFPPVTNGFMNFENGVKNSYQWLIDVMPEGWSILSA